MKRNPSRSGTEAWRTSSPSSAGSTPPPSSNAGGCSTALKRRSTSVGLFCFKLWPTDYRKEFSAASGLSYRKGGVQEK
jgi:hypothetical protein